VRLALGTDERTVATDALAARLAAQGHEIVLEVVDRPWPEVGRRVAEEVVSGRAERGVVWCWTGTGVSLAANKVPGARAALCVDAETARGARRWNDANVLALSLRLTTEQVAGEIVDAFLDTPADPDEAATIATVEPG